MRVIVKSTSNQYIESAIAGFSGCGYQIRPGNCAKLGADKNGGAFFYTGGFEIVPFGAYIIAWPGIDGAEYDLVLFVRLLYAGGTQVFQNDLNKIPRFLGF